MAARATAHEAAEHEPGTCASDPQPDPHIRTLRSAASSGLIEGEDAHTTGYVAARDGHAVLVRATKRKPPDLDRFVAALLAMALADRDDEHQPDKKE